MPDGYPVVAGTYWSAAQRASGDQVMTTHTVELPDELLARFDLRISYEACLGYLAAAFEGDEAFCDGCWSDSPQTAVDSLVLYLEGIEE